MSGFRVTTPSRLHFGLFGWGPGSARQFGGVGLMIEEPGLMLSARPADRWSARGPLAEKALLVAERVEKRLAGRGIDVEPLEIEVSRAPRPHVGLGSGTQLALAVARLIAEASGRPSIPAASLAEWSGRGLRSGIGLHGFDLGGLIVDGGRRLDVPGGVPPMLARLEFPPDWPILVIVPPTAAGLHGPDEAAAFDRLPAVPAAITDRLCRLALVGLLPAVAERDLDGFGSALVEIQRLVGSVFAPAQGGGVFADPGSAEIAAWLESEGVRGVGQSSWGPTLYGFSDETADRRSGLLDELYRRFSIEKGDAFWTVARNHGAIVDAIGPC